MRVTRTYLQLLSADQLRPAAAPEGAFALVHEDPCDPALSRALYDLVGHAYHWHDRHAWSDAALAEYLAQAAVQVWVLRDGDALAGYFELLRHRDGGVEIAYFGLAPDYLGRGLGKWLLTCAAQAAWRAHPTRVWLHTCTLDHPAALPNYVARGFAPYAAEEYTLSG